MNHTHSKKGHKIPEILRPYEPVVHCIADLFGCSCEVVLHDTRYPNRSVVIIRNGHVTGRTVNSPLTNLGIEILRRKNFRRVTLGNYFTHLKNGKTLKSNAVLIHDEHGKLAGMLCINFDVTPLIALDQTMRAFYMKSPNKKEPVRYKERHTKDVPTLIQSMIRDAMNRNVRHSLKLDRSERLQIVCELYQRGVFRARGAVRLVAQALGVSNISIYKYLEEVR